MSPSDEHSPCTHLQHGKNSRCLTWTLAESGQWRTKWDSSLAWKRPHILWHTVVWQQCMTRHSNLEVPSSNSDQLMASESALQIESMVFGVLQF